MIRNHRAYPLLELVVCVVVSTVALPVFLGAWAGIVWRLGRYGWNLVS